jgi:O-antigen/teichoic acid export membrane protein
LTNIHYTEILNPYISKNSLWLDFKIALPFALIVLTEIMFSSIDSFFVEHYFSAYDLGYYEAIKKIVVGLTIICVVLGIALMPNISKWASEINKYRLRIIESFIGVSAIGLVFFLIYVLFNNEIIYILLGSKYALLGSWDTHIGIIVLCSYIRIVPGHYFVANNHHRIRLWLTFISLVIGFISYYIFLDKSDIRNAVKMTAYLNLFFTIIYILGFIYIFFIKQNYVTSEKK